MQTITYPLDGIVGRDDIAEHIHFMAPRRDAGRATWRAFREQVIARYGLHSWLDYVERDDLHN